MSTASVTDVAASARSVLARASSARVVWLDPEYAQRHPGLVTAVVLDRPDGETPGHRSPVMVEVADPAPVPVRDRVRARVRLYGDAARAWEFASGIRLRPVSVQLEVDETCTGISPSELWQADPDPLAHAEAPFLGHLADAHADALDELAQLLPGDVRANAVRVAPLALDRYGIVLRAEHAHGHQDVRLGFAKELTAPDQARAAVADLLEAAAAKRAAQTQNPAPPGRLGGLLAALLGAGPAATRICSPHE